MWSNIINLRVQNVCNRAVFIHVHVCTCSISYSHINEQVFTVCVCILIFCYMYVHLDPSVSMVTVNDNATMGAETVSIGSNVTLNCTMTGTTPTSTVQWTVNGIPLTEGVTTPSDVDSTELLISPFLQCGEYRCSVTNVDGQTSFGTVQLFGDIESELEIKKIFLFFIMHCTCMPGL